MKIVIPTDITAAMLTQTSLPENDAPEWSAATAYAAGARVMTAATHTLFEAVKPSTGLPPASTPDAWLRVGPTNCWAMFDDSLTTRSTASQRITVTLRPGILTTLALINLLGVQTVRVTMIDPVEGVVFQEEHDMLEKNVRNWWEYFFIPPTRRESLILFDIPSYPLASIKVELEGPAEIGVGLLALGVLKEFSAGVEMGAQISIDDYSVKERDEFGNVNLVERAFSRRASWKFHIPNGDVDGFVRTLAALRAKPCVYIGANRMDTMTIYGFYRDFTVNVQYPNHSDVSIQIEGMT